MLKRFFEKLYLRLLKRREFDSVRLRTYFEKRYGIAVGLYSYGCFDSGRIRPGTKIGRYCSFAPSAFVFTRNHPLSYLTTHPFLYERQLGLHIARDLPFGACEIEDDVWIGHNSSILSGVKCIGRGSIIGAGAVVTKDVPRYAVVMGVPATVVRFRFPPEVIERIESSRWWEKSFEELSQLILNHPTLAFDPTNATESDWTQQ